MDEAPRSGPAQRRYRQRVQARVEKERQRLEAARGESITVSFAFDAMSYDSDTGAPVLAAALGFRVFLFLVPYIYFFMIIGGYASITFNRNPNTMFTGRGIAHLAATSVATTASFSEGARVVALLVVAYALILSARSFVKVLYIVHTLVWAVPRSKPARPTRAALLFIAIVTVGAVLAGLIDKLRQQVVLGAVASVLLYTVLLAAGWWYVSWWLPHRDCPLIALMPGAMVFAIGSILLQMVTVLWFPRYLTGKSEVYGTLGVSVAILLWAYILGRLMTLAAVLNASLWARFGADSDHPIDLHQPSWRVPLLDDKLGRLWTLLFGDHNRNHSGHRSDNDGGGPAP
jgi:membrane protein